MRLRSLRAALACALLSLATLPATAADEAVIQEVLAILKERGIVDEAKYAELVGKNEAYEAKQSSLLSKIVLTGDFRGRLESYWFDEDELGGDPNDRHRTRYRLRIGAVVPVNEWLTAGFRLASGETENRSTNRSLGAGVDFDRDRFELDEAWLQLKLPIDAAPTTVVFGKQSNPFLWKNGKDYMTWDPDYSLEGLSVRSSLQATPKLGLFASAGYFLIEESRFTKDPHFFGLQGGATLQASEQLALGGRVTWLSYGSLNAGFFTRQAAFGNVALSNDSDGSFDQLESSLFARVALMPKWPVLLHAHLAKNLDAASIAGEGKQDLGWGLALELGDPKQTVLLGVGYYALEADFGPALYTDSDVLDGFTNREGWAFYGSRHVFPNTELSLELFLSDELETGIPFATSVSAADRLRLRSDVIVKF
ncbi:MAG: putative porin [Deltaproteobacteria bacterium]|nr:putative porin [Deltaproteobacteria bacterium]